jgi:lysophospholipase L1-like esterase
MHTTSKCVILYSIVCIEVAIFAVLGYRLIDVIRKKNNVLGRYTLVKLPKENYIASSSLTFKYFYEYGPYVENVDTWPFLTEKVVNKSTADGMNSSHEYMVPKPAGVFRIVALGDSFTFGLHVNTEDAWPNYLERYLNTQCKNSGNVSFEVVNMGVPGYDLLYEVERFRLRGVTYEPDMVLWMLIDNDFTDINDYMRDIANPIYEQMKEEGTLDPVNGWVKPMEIAKNEMMKQYTMEEILHILDSHVTAFHSLYSGELAFVSFVTIHPAFREHIQTWVSQWSNSYYFSDIPDIDQLHLTLPDGHPSKEGHQKIAESVYQYLVGNNLILCK